MVEDYAESLQDKSILNDLFNNLEHIDPISYSQVLDIRRKRIQTNRYKNDIMSNISGNPFKNNF